MGRGSWLERAWTKKKVDRGSEMRNLIVFMGGRRKEDRERGGYTASLAAGT